MAENKKYLVQMSILDLMAQKNMNVSDIAAACGFKNTAIFEHIIQSEQRFPLDKVGAPGCPGPPLRPQESLFTRLDRLVW